MAKKHGGSGKNLACSGEGPGARGGGAPAEKILASKLPKTPFFHIFSAIFIIFASVFGESGTRFTDHRPPPVPVPVPV